jgi:hypothetical protein
MTENRQFRFQAGYIYLKMAAAAFYLQQSLFKRQNLLTQVLDGLLALFFLLLPAEDIFLYSV